MRVPVRSACGNPKTTTGSLPDAEPRALSAAVDAAPRSDACAGAATATKAVTASTRASRIWLGCGMPLLRQEGARAQTSCAATLTETRSAGATKWGRAQRRESLQRRKLPRASGGEFEPDAVRASARALHAPGSADLLDQEEAHAAGHARIERLHGRHGVRARIGDRHSETRGRGCHTQLDAVALIHARVEHGVRDQLGGEEVEVVKGAGGRDLGEAVRDQLASGARGGRAARDLRAPRSRLGMDR